MKLLHGNMKNPNQTKAACTIYFDGACPICSKEIATYRKWKGGEQLVWVDASQCTDDELGENLTRQQALARLHCRDATGELVDGAAAFVAIWSHLRGLSYLSPLLSRPLILAMLERIYRGFLKLRLALKKRSIL